MSDSTIARRYAQAFYNEAEAKDAISEADAEMEAIRKSFSESAELRRFFESPVINRDQKDAVIQKLFGGKISKQCMNLLQLLVKKGRENIAEQVVQAYATIRDEVEGRVEASAKSAIELSDGDQTALSTALEKITGKKVRLNTEVDSSLIGGLVVRIGDTVYDGSVKHQLAILRERMERGAYLSN